MNNRRRLLQFSCAQSIAIAIGFPAANVLAASDDYAPDAACRELALEAGEVSDVLEKFSVETGMSIVVDHRLIEGLSSPAVVNAPGCAEALAIVLSSANLNIHKVNGSTLVISEPAPSSVVATPIATPIQTPVVAPPPDEIIVTGSRLFSPDLRSTAPLLSIDGDEIDARGVTRMEDLLNILPSAFAGQTSQLANGASGTSNLNLRGLGDVRTLVLVDGKRLPYGSPNFAASNLDLIPAQLVERVDVVTGGVSAVYGSDAVAGVANFILRRDFEGIEFDGQVGFFQDGNSGEFVNALLDINDIEAPGATLDGRNVALAVTFGANTADERGNVTAFFSYQNQNEIRQDARDFSTCALGPAMPGPQTIGGVGCIGSASFRRFVTPSGDFFLEDGGAFSPFVNAPEQTFNFAPENFIQRPIERFSSNIFARYQIAGATEAYLDFGYTQNSTDAQVAFSSSFFRPFLVNCDNPFLDGAVPSGDTLAGALGCDAAAIAEGEERSLIFGHRNVEGDPRNSSIQLRTFRVIGGVRGGLEDGWNWDAFGQFARTKLVNNSTGDVSFSRLQDALFVVDDGGGNAVCRSRNPECVPFNVFQRSAAGESLVTPEAARAVQGNGIVSGFTEQKVIGATLQSELSAYGLQSPWAENGIRALLGAEWREDQLVSQPDEISQKSNGRGFTGLLIGAQQVEGAVSVWELFGETKIPVVEHKPFFEELSLNGTYRYSHHMTDGNGTESDFDTHTFSVGLIWSVAPSIRFRSQFQRAVRAPNVLELFTGLSTNQFSGMLRENGLFDPCAGDFDPSTILPEPSATAAQCAFSGVTAAQFGSIPGNPSGQFNIVTGGNSSLNPETSNTFTVGVIAAPQLFSGLRVGADYFDITVDDAISTIAPNIVLNQCLETGNSFFCDRVVRDEQGSLFLDNTNFEGISVQNINTSSLATRGVDFFLEYSYDLGDWGVLSSELNATYLMEISFDTVPGVTEALDCAGLFANDCVIPQPEYRHRMLSTWQTPWDVDINATWRYFGGVQRAPSSSSSFFNGDNFLGDSLDSANYLDLSVRWFANDNLTFRAGVQNLFGRDPELQTGLRPPFGNGNTLPGSFDPNGRLIFLGVNLRG